MSVFKIKHYKNYTFELKRISRYKPSGHREQGWFLA